MSYQPPSLQAESPPRRTLRVAMLTYSFYESDNRVRRYAETLARRGDSVDVISLRREGQGEYNELKGVKVHRIQKRTRDEKGKFSYLFRILKFFLKSTLFLSVKSLRHRYDLIHVHSVPDFEVFAALIPKLAGARIILDIHDIVPELYASKFGAGKTSVLFKTLLLIEKAAIAFSNHVIISNDLWRERLISRSVRPSKCTTILNYPDRAIFTRGPGKRENGKLVFLYPGTLNFHQGLDIAVKAFDKIKNELGPAEFHIYGDGPAKELLEELVRGCGLQNRVLLKDPVPLDEIADIMANSDVGVIPKRNDSFGGEAFSTKTLEFMSLGVPIILSRTRIDDYYFNDEVVRFFEPGGVDALAEAMLTMATDRTLRSRLSEKALEFAESHGWNRKQGIYLALVDALCGNDAIGEGF